MTKIEFMNMLIEKYKHESWITELYSVNCLNALGKYIEENNFSDEEYDKFWEEFREDDISSTRAIY